MADRAMPTRPGWWWCRDHRGNVVVARVRLSGHGRQLESDFGVGFYNVLDDGRWIAPVATPDELASLRADESRATEYADLAARLDDDLAAATMELRWWRGEGPGDGLALFGLRGGWQDGDCDAWYAETDGPSPWALLCATGTEWMPAVYNDEGEESYRGEPMGLLAAMREAEREALARGWVP